MTAHDLEVRAIEMLTLRVRLPRMWKPRLWLAGRVFLVGAWLTGTRCEITVE
jgi:hypothetical protein